MITLPLQYANNVAFYDSCKYASWELEVGRCFKSQSNILCPIYTVITVDHHTLQPFCNTIALFVCAINVCHSFFTVFDLSHTTFILSLSLTLKSTKSKSVFQTNHVSKILKQIPINQTDRVTGGVHFISQLSLAQSINHRVYRIAKSIHFIFFKLYHS